jgi:hypothetical protein
MTTKKQFKQSDFDKLMMCRAKVIIALRKARKEVNDYVKTHTRGY